MNKIFLNIMLLIILTISAHSLSQVSEASFSIVSSHPRLLITANDISSLRNRCQNISPYKEAYTALKSRVDGWSAPTTNRYIIGYEIQAVVFVALIENYNLTYLNKVDQWLTNLFVTQGVVNLAFTGDSGAIWGSADIILGVAMAYDLLYPALSSAKRTQYGTYLRDFQQAVITAQGGMARDASRSDYSNQFYFFDGMLAITGITLYNEGIDNSLALTYLNTFDNYLHNNMIPTVNQVGGSNGGWHEGLGYADRAMTYFTLQLEAWRIGAGENLFPQAVGLKGLSKWLFYSTQPDGNVVNIADVSGWPKRWGAGEGRRASLLGARYKDGFSQYIANRIDSTAGNNWPYMVFYLLWYDSSVAEINPITINLDKHFDGIGWVSMRSGWDSNAIFAMFYSGNYYFGHQHYDQNSFMIFKNAPLAIDNGIYNVGSPNYKKATRFHNTILVGSPGADTSLDDSSAGQSGASPMYYIPDPENSSSDKGDIALFDDNVNFTYAIGDASKAYSSARLTTFIRKFLYIKPDYFVILDRIVLPSTTYPIRWLLQSENMPDIVGNEIKITNGSGRLFSKTLLPTQITASVATVFQGVAEYGGGNYRIEVVPAINRTEEHFLHVLWATDSGAIAMPAAQLITSTSSNLTGALFSNFAALLSQNGTVAAQETYTVSTTGALKHFIGDLLSGGEYRIYQNGNLILTKTASKGGVLQFDSNGGGNFTIAFTGTQIDLIPPASPSGLKIQ